LELYEKRQVELTSRKKKNDKLNLQVAKKKEDNVAKVLGHCEHFQGSKFTLACTG